MIGASYQNKHYNLQSTFISFAKGATSIKPLRAAFCRHSKSGTKVQSSKGCRSIRVHHLALAMLKAFLFLDQRLSSFAQPDSCINLRLSGHIRDFGRSMYRLVLGCVHKPCTGVFVMLAPFSKLNYIPANRRFKALYRACVECNP